MKLITFLFAGLMSVSGLFGQISNAAFTGRNIIDFSSAVSSKPAKAGTSVPATCGVGEVYFKTDATAGQNLYYCTATNTWTQQLNSGVGTLTAVGDCTTGACFTSAGTGTAQVFKNATSGQITLQTVSGALGTRVISLPAVTGTVVTTGDTGSVSNTMLAGSIAASKLIGSDIATVGTITTGVWSGTSILPAKLDFTADNTTSDATSGHHGLLPKLSGSSGDCFLGNGTYSTCPGGSSASFPWTATRENGTGTNTKIRLNCDVAPNCQVFGGNGVLLTTISTDITADISTNGSSVAGDMYIYYTPSTNTIFCSENTSAVLTVSGCTAASASSIPALSVAVGKSTGTYHFATTSAFDDPSTSPQNPFPVVPLCLPGDGIGVTVDGTTGSCTTAVDATVQRVSTPTLYTAGTTVSLTAPRQYYECTGTCTVTPPTPAAGYEFCVFNTTGVTTVITLAAIASVYYEKTDHTGYATNPNATFTSGGAAGDAVCIVGKDTTHYVTRSFNGTWTTH